MTYQLNTGIPDVLAGELKAYAADRGISISAAVRILIHEGLSRGWPATGNEGQS